MSLKNSKRTRLFELIKDNLSILSSWAIFVIIILLFQSKISLFISTSSIITEKEVKNNYFYFAYISLVMILIMRFLWFIFKNYRLSKKYNYLIFLVSIIYLFIRNNEDDTLWFSVYNVKLNFYYTDIILLMSFLSLVLLVRNIFYSNYKLYDVLIKWFNDLKKKQKKLKLHFF